MNDFSDFFYRKKIIITGASGFIGSHLSRELMHQGAEVYAFVRKESDLWRLQSITNKIEIIEVDLLDSLNVNKLIHLIKPNCIFHFAIPAHSWLQNKHDLQTQIDITTGHLISLFKPFQSKNIKLNSFVHACSGSIYKWDKNKFLLNESTPLEPTTLRGMLKLNQRNLCLHLSKTCNVPVKLARIFRAYGPWEISSKLIIKALDADKKGEPIALGNDEYKRDYIFIDDLIDGILKLATNTQTNVMEMNFGSNSQYSASEIIQKMERILGRSIPKRLNAYPKNLYDQGNFIADCSFANTKLGWKPCIGIELGLQKTINWYNTYYS